ncbi:hypothetical protein [Streptomyces sp. NPDC053541]
MSTAPVPPATMSAAPMNTVPVTPVTPVTAVPAVPVATVPAGAAA